MTDAVMPPMGVVGCPSDQWIVLANEGGVAVALDSFVCFPAGFEFRMLVRARSSSQLSGVSVDVLPEFKALRCLVVDEERLDSGAVSQRYQPWSIELQGFNFTDSNVNIHLSSRFPAIGQSLEVQVQLPSLSLVGVPLRLELNDLRARASRAISIV